MSYYTAHYLCVYDYTTATASNPTGMRLSSGPVWNKVLDYMDTIPSMCDQKPFCIQELGWDGDECRWYEEDDDMKNLSLAFPTLLFEVEGRGEDGDVWCTRYLNGKAARVRAVFPPFDPRNLR